MKISYFLRDDGACGWYRCESPMQVLAENKIAQIMKITKGDSSDKIEKSLESDIIVIPRIGELPFLDAMRAMQDKGKKVVVDHDDNMFCISPFSPHYQDFGTEEVSVSIEGEMVPLWQDGKNINLKDNQQRVDYFKRAIEQADLVTVTTPILADVYREYTDKIKVLPNCVDARLWKRLPLQRENKEEVRLFWAGGSSHFEDWVLLQEVLPKILVKYPEAKLVLMGCKFDGTLKDIPKDRLEFHPWVHTKAYPYKTAILDADISIIPLVDNQFNSCKSNIKWIEQSTLSIPSVCSFVSPYKEAYNGVNGVFIEDNDTQGWVDGISMMIEDKVLRYKTGEASRITALRDYDINTQYVQWAAAYKELIDG